MSSVTREQVEEQLRQLGPEQLAVVSRFITSLTYLQSEIDEEHSAILLAAETSLRKDWDTPAEDAAWAHL